MDKMSIEYVPGASLNESYFVATELDDAGAVKDRVAVRASQIVPPALRTEAEENKAAVDSEDFVEEFKKTCKTLDAFKRVAFNVASNNAAIVATAADKGDGPTWATEDRPTVKAESQPEAAVEGNYSPEKVERDGTSDVSKLFGQLPKKSVADAERALDMQSKVQALTEALQAKSAELEGVKSELDNKKKEGELEDVMKSLTDLGLVEDAKDREQYTKMLGSLPEAAVGVIEKLLKDIVDVVEEEGDDDDDGAPRPPKSMAPKPPAPPKKEAPAGPPMGAKAPPFGAKANILTASLEDEEDGASVASDSWTGARSLANLWGQKQHQDDLKTAKLLQKPRG
jgi:hypothetical protein